MKVGLISIRFSPGQFSHIVAFYCMSKDIGVECELQLDAQYKPFVQDSKELKNAEVKWGIEKYSDCNVFIFFNSSQYDFNIIDNIHKNNTRAKVLYIYHEPWYGIKPWADDLIHHRVKWIVPVKSVVIHMLMMKTLKKSDLVLLPSTGAERIYNRSDIRHNHNYTIFPLVYCDESVNYDISGDRPYFSYIATADHEKNFPLFLQTAKKALEQMPDLKVRIVSKTDVKEYWIDGLEEYVENGRLEINAGHVLSNEEINIALSKSFCSWTYYHHTTQSGVVERAMMLGSPVIASDAGSFKDIVDGNNGIIVDEKLEPEVAIDEIIDKLHYFQLYKAEMSRSARKTFVEQFLYDSYINKYREVLGLESRSEGI